MHAVVWVQGSGCTQPRHVASCRAVLPTRPCQRCCHTPSLTALRLLSERVHPRAHFHELPSFSLPCLPPASSLLPLCISLAAVPGLHSRCQLLPRLQRRRRLPHEIGGIYQGPGFCAPLLKCATVDLPPPAPCLPQPTLTPSVLPPTRYRKTARPPTL